MSNPLDLMLVTIDCFFDMFLARLDALALLVFEMSPDISEMLLFDAIEVFMCLIDFVEWSLAVGMAYRICWQGWTPIYSGVTIVPFVRLNGFLLVRSMS